ncbi:MAG: hypothetical protein OSJ76_05945 [Alphaproteobacteria bacterium]|nr:hypothetical protein [Alphaproteobacteria bacterium]
MWNWLVKFMVETPLPSSSCGCCEARNKKLREMQQAIETGELPEEEDIVSGRHWHMGCSVSCGSEEHCCPEPAEEKQD